MQLSFNAKIRKNIHANSHTHTAVHTYSLKLTMFIGKVCLILEIKRLHLKVKYVIREVLIKRSLSISGINLLDGTFGKDSYVDSQWRFLFSMK